MTTTGPHTSFMQAKVKWARKPVLLALLTCAVMLAISGWSVWLSEKNRIAALRAEVTILAEQHAGMVERSIDTALSSTFALAAMVRYHHGDFSEFPAYAREMLLYYRGVSSLALAPNGVVSRIYPLAGNEKAIGHDLLNDPGRDKEARLARDSGRLTMAGPFNLVQGGIGAVGRYPVYLTNAAGKTEFWGLVTALIRFPEAIDNTMLTSLAARGYVYELWRIHPDTGERHVFAASSPGVALVDPVGVSMAVPNAHWVLSVAPQAGWTDSASLAAKSALGLFISLVMAVLVWSLAELKTRKDALQRANLELEKISVTDELTGAWNRRHFEQVLGIEIARSKRYDQPLSLILLDVDHFKSINDVHGHQAGDRVLVELATLVRGNLRSTDLFARWGGEEFALLTPHCDEGCAIRLAEKLRTLIETHPFRDLEQITASFGVTQIAAGESTETAFRRADEALYAAKSAGRNRVQTLQPASENAGLLKPSAAVGFLA